MAKLDLDDVLEEVCAEVEATGTITLAAQPPEINYTQLDEAGGSAKHTGRNGDIRKYSGSYDNIPESWSKIVKTLEYMDDDPSATQFLLSLPTDNVNR
jgi:hypothetical protein